MKEDKGVTEMLQIPLKKPYTILKQICLSPTSRQISPFPFRPTCCDDSFVVCFTGCFFVPPASAEVTPFCSCTLT